MKSNPTQPSVAMHQFTQSLKVMIPLTVVAPADAVLLDTVHDEVQSVREEQKHCHCGLVKSARTWDGTGCEFDSWQCRIYIRSHVHRAYNCSGPFGVSGYIGLDTKIVSKKR